MDTFYAYLLKSAVAMILFYAFYRLVIFQNTFFRVRRFTLLAILGFSVFYPLIDIADWLSEREPVYEILTPYLVELPEVSVEVQQTSTLSVGQIGVGIYLLVVFFLFMRMLIQFGSILRLRKQAKQIVYQQHPVYMLSGLQTPFSFFYWIFMDPDQITEQEAEQIFIHERTHCSQFHSVDVLIGELITIFFWFNPFAWLLKQEIRVNLEHLADEKVIASGTEATSYQYALLRLCHSIKTNKLVNNFYIPQFKRRIMMMNKNKSARNSLLRYAFLIPVAGLLVVSGNAQAVVGKVKMELTKVAGLTAVAPATIKGQVLDQDKKPLPGVSIVIKGTSRGTLTDSDGHFKLPIESGETLVFSYVGKNTAEIVPDLANNKSLSVILPDKMIRQDELVVVGYGKEPAQQDAHPQKAKSEKKNSDTVFTVVEEMPSFKGGDQALMAYLGKSIKYPAIAQENGIQGRVLVSYVISPEGKIMSPEILRGVDPSLDAEALRIVREMPDWNPGKQRGKAVAVKYVLPITFRLNQNDKPEQKNPSEIVPAPAGSADEALRVHSSTGVAQKELLVVVDGEAMPAGFVLNNITPDRIESITILKGEKAFAEYGERARKGAILITTKK